MLASKDCEDAAFSEEAYGYPFDEKQRQPLSESHRGIFIKASPHVLGHPVVRWRTLGVLLNLRSWIWVGQKTDLAVQQHWESVMARRLLENGSVYCRATDDDFAGMIRDLACSQKKQLPKDYKRKPFRQLMNKVWPVGAVTRFDEWELHRESLDPALRKMFSDVDHHPGHGPGSSDCMPTLITHHRIFDYARDRMVHPKEELASMGIDVFDDLSGGRGRSPLAHQIQTLPINEQQFLIGNGMHSPLYIAFMFFILGNVVPIEDFYKLSRAIYVKDDSDDEKERLCSRS
jgi:hypothetical protein